MSLYSLYRPLLFSLAPETAHRLASMLLRMDLFGRPGDDPDSLKTRVAGLDFPNPIGLAAGFDKDAKMVPAMFRLGFGFVEIGTVTARPQAGNPKPRIFRLVKSEALINRIGFKSDGAEAVCRRIKMRPHPGIVGVNLGANKDSGERIADYGAGVWAFAGLADYITINVSSPNTPGLRELQAPDLIAKVIDAVNKAQKAAGMDVPVFVKLSPDIGADVRDESVDAIMEAGAQGIIVSNTTLDRPEGLEGKYRGETGGLSGRPLFGKSTDLLARVYERTKGRIALIGVGGVFSGSDAYRKIRAGADLVQLYTGLIYEGPGLIRRIKKDLAGRLEADGFASVADAVGADHR